MRSLRPICRGSVGQDPWRRDRVGVNTSAHRSCQHEQMTARGLTKASREGLRRGQFRATWSGTQFRNLLPFAIADPKVYVSPGPPDLTSLDYAAAFAEVKLLGNAAIPDADKFATFQFWSLGAGTDQPPGAWIQIALA